MIPAADRSLRVLVAIVATLALASSTGTVSASGAERLTVTTGNVPSWNGMFAGGGVYLFNRPGGYYLGRVFDGEQFLATDTHLSAPQTGGGRQTYHWGAPASRPDTCVWMGPRATSTTSESFVTPSGAQPVTECAADDPARAALAITPSAERPDDSRFGSDFNCPAGGVGGPQETTVAAGADQPFFYNVAWTLDGLRYVAGDGLPNPQGTLTVKAGAPILYRYSSGGMAVVYDPVLGWGFVPRAAVAPVTGSWGFESAGSWQLACDQAPSIVRVADDDRQESGSFINGPLDADHVAGDWNGDGVTTVGHFAAGVFELRDSNTAGATQRHVVFGAAGDRALAGDWNGDGASSPGVFRAGTFFLTESAATGQATVDHTVALGSATALPVAGDWNGDGSYTVGVFEDGVFTLAASNDTGANKTTVAFGRAGDIPVSGDWDGDGDDDLAVQRDGTFLLAEPGEPGVSSHATVFAFGQAGDRPLAGDWDGDGTASVATWAPHKRPAH